MKISEIKEKIPHGGMKVIANRTGLNYITVSRFFNENIKTSTKTKTRILNVTADYLREVKEREERALKQFTNI